MEHDVTDNKKNYMHTYKCKEVQYMAIPCLRFVNTMTTNTMSMGESADRPVVDNRKAAGN